VANPIPNFLIIGAAKAATTTLASLISQHPQAGIVAGKEPHFFSMDVQYHKGWSWYQGGFQHCRHEIAVGDASTSYSRIRYHPETINRILEHIPDVKIIYMVRQPLDRIVSAYIERIGSVDFNKAYPSINHAVQAEPMMIDSSRYWEVYSYYRAHIDEERIKVVWFEDFIDNTLDTFHMICRFLDIDDSISIEANKAHQNSREQVLNTISHNRHGSYLEYNTTWDNKVRAWVLDQIRDDSKCLLDHFDKPLNYWGDLS